MRLILQTIMTFGLGLALIYFALPKLRSWGHGQRVRRDGPQSHLKKSGTPTFGGVFFLLPMVLIWFLRLLVLGTFDAFQVIFLLIFSFALVGFWDDYTKVVIRPEGINVKQKTLAMGLAGLAFGLYFVFGRAQEPFFILPFSQAVVKVQGVGKVFYLIFIVLYLFYMANSVNLSDGVDGLCSSLMLVATASLSLVLWRLQGTWNSPLVEVIALLFAGAAAFLCFNKQPAKIFMGDTGSLSLGVGLAAVALWAGIPWIMVLTGLVFIAEGLSSLLQTGYYKLSGGKRIFRMAPLHHHFELGGWSENKVVLVFSLVGLAFGLLALACV